MAKDAASRWRYHSGMKSNESTIARGRSVAIEIFSSTATEELERILDLGLSEGSFRVSVERSATVPVRGRFLPRCEQAAVQPGLSGLKPKIFLSNELSEVEVSTAIAQSLFEMARSIYLGLVSGADQSDLDVWLSAGLPAAVQLVPPRFIEAYGDDRTMLRIDTADVPAALGSFTALRRLVLLDG